MIFFNLSRSISEKINIFLKDPFIKLRILDKESSVMLLTSLIVGIIAGLGAVAFRKLIEWIQNLAYGDISKILSDWHPIHLIVIPALGGAIVGPLVYYFAREAKGHGVPEVMESLELRGGIIRPRVVFVKSLASSVCIASGGSVGREGPIAQIGSAIGSSIGQLLKLTKEQIRTLVACGAAGGVAATFNAPIAGAVFALEVLLRRFGSVYFGAVVISAVTADVIAHYFEGDKRTFLTPEYTLQSPWELLLYTLMGVIAAIAAVGFSRLLYFSEDIWNSIKIPEPTKPIFGGVLLGLLGIFSYQIDGFPRIFGVGYLTIENTLFSELTLQLTFGLLILKLIATTLTLGSGGSGGIFAPSLFMGAMLGASFGHISYNMFPEIVAPSGAYALVGMAAFVGGATHAPITAILILFEMTGDYQIILPLMLSTVLSTIVSRNLNPYSIYSLKLKRRGINLSPETRSIDLMQGVSAKLAMNNETEAVQIDLPLIELMGVFSSTHFHAIPVVKNGNQLVGLITIKELDKVRNEGNIESKTIKDILHNKSPATIFPHQPVWMALQYLEDQGEGCVPVVSESKKSILLGVLRRIDIIRAYNKAVIDKAQDQHHEEILNIRKLEKSGLSEILIRTNSPNIGKRVKELNIGKDNLIVSIRRSGKLKIVRGDSIFQAGDKVTIFSEKPKTEFLENLLNENLKNSDPQGNSLFSHLELEIPEGISIDGIKIRELDFPENCVIVKIVRKGKIILPRGDIFIKVGDTVEIFGMRENLEKARQLLTS